jgi:chorismate mutase-like protein
MDDLESMRREIEEVDDDIVALLGARFAIIERIGKLKARNDVPIVILERIEAVKQRAAEKGLDYDLNPAFIEKLFQLIIDEAIAREEALAKS